MSTGRPYVIVTVLCAILSITILCSTIAVVLTMSKRGPIVQIVGGHVYDWGTILEGARLSHDFVLKNVGSQILAIKRVKTSCGCTHATISKKSVEPGEEALVTIDYVGRPLTAPEVLKAWVETNDPQKPVTTLTMTGRIQLQVFWYPNALSFLEAIS